MKEENPPAAALRAPVSPRTRRSTVAAANPVDAGRASQDAIASRAYQLFEARNRQHGFDLEDWLRAEAELTVPVPARKRAVRSRTSPRG